jgi:hypothetical protein
MPFAEFLVFLPFFWWFLLNQKVCFVNFSF